MSNLQDMFAKENVRKFMVFSEQHRAKMSASQKVSRPKHIHHGGRCPKAIMTPEGKFDTAKSYAAHVGVALITVYKRIERFPDQYYFVKEAA